jgi:hypothetical protein
VRFMPSAQALRAGSRDPLEPKATNDAG